MSREAAVRLGRVVGSTHFEELERGEFISEELELRPFEVGSAEAFEDDELVRASARDFEEAM